ncbi:erythrocyte binding antigen-140 [Plasmodium sp.]|nr:erythrocyte binding antigen-140 [Plasmodium sp.]
MKGYFNIYFLITLILLYNVIKMNDSIRSRTLYNRENESSDILGVNSPELNNNHKTNIYNSDYQNIDNTENQNVNNKLINSFLENRTEKKRRSLSSINKKKKLNDIIPSSYSYRNDKFNSLSEIEYNSGSTNSNNLTNTSEISIEKNNKKYTFIQKSTTSVACGVKRKSLKWVCRENSQKIIVCTPDRKIQLCIANFLNSRLESLAKFKQIFLISLNMEAALLHEKNEGKSPSIFCNDLRNSFLDFRNLFLGDDMDFGGNTDKLKEYINKRFSVYYNKTRTDYINDIKKKWWENNKQELWNHMIEKYKGKISNECNNFPIEEPQINRWIKEWNENFWIRKEKYFLRIPEKCAENQKYEACFGVCCLRCSTYISFLRQCKSEKDILTNWYKIKNSGKNTDNFLNEVFKKNNQTNLVDFFKNQKEYEDLCDCKYTVTMIKRFLNGPAKDNVDIASEININDIRAFGCNYKSNNKKSWNCTGSFAKIFPGACVPPRRQSLCLGRAYRLTGGHEERYREHLLGALIYEAQLLKHRYKEKSENALCSIIQSSYADMADIVKGSDIMKDEYGRDMEENLNKINKDKDRNEASLKRFREQWWDKNKDVTWKVMSAVLKNKEECKNSDKFQKIPQFLRWFKEWGDDFCQERKEKIYSFKSFKEECKKKDCEENTCNNKCNEYKKWIDLKKNEYDEQVEKYKKDKNEKMYDNIDEVKDKEANVYLKENSKACEDVNFEDKIFSDRPNEYEEMCAKCNEIKFLNEIKYPKTKHSIYDIDILSDAFGGGTPISINANTNGQQNKGDASISENTEAKDSNVVPEQEIKVSSNVEEGGSDESTSEEEEILDNNELRVTENVNGESHEIESEIEDDDENRGLIGSEEENGLLSYTDEQGNIVDRIEDEDEKMNDQTDNRYTRLNVIHQSNDSGNSGTNEKNHIEGDNKKVHIPSNTPNIVHNAPAINAGRSEQSFNTTTNTLNTKIVHSESGESDNKRRTENSNNQVNRSHSSHDLDSLSIEKVGSEYNKPRSHDSQGSHSGRHNVLASSETHERLNEIEVPDHIRNNESDDGDKIHQLSEQLEEEDITSDHINNEVKTLSNNNNLPSMNKGSEKSVNSHDFIRSGMTNNDENSQYKMQIQNNGKIREQKEVEGDNVNYEDDQNRTNIYSENNDKKNIQEYNSRDTKRVREEIIKLSKQNKCDNKYSMEYCTYSDGRNSSTGPCPREERKRLCCQISDYCLKYFNFYSIEYYNCIKSEFKSSEYKCFNSEGRSNMAYFAAGGILVIIALLLSSSTVMGKSNEEYIVGEPHMEAAFEDNDYLNKLSRIFNQEVQETNISDFSEYNYNEKNMY